MGGGRPPSGDEGRDPSAGPRGSCARCDTPPPPGRAAGGWAHPQGAIPTITSFRKNIGAKQIVTKILFFWGGGNWEMLCGVLLASIAEIMPTTSWFKIQQKKARKSFAVGCLGFQSD